MKTSWKYILTGLSSACVATLGLSFWVNEIQKEAKLRWMQCQSQRMELATELCRYENYFATTGTRYVRKTSEEFIKEISDPPTKEANYVWYLGSSNGMDYVVHHVDDGERLLSVPEGVLQLKSKKQFDEDRAKAILVYPY